MRARDEWATATGEPSHRGFRKVRRAGRGRMTIARDADSANPLNKPLLTECRAVPQVQFFLFPYKRRVDVILVVLGVPSGGAFGCMPSWLAFGEYFSLPVFLRANWIVT